MARLYANENFPLPVVVELRRLGHDVLTIHETGKAGQSVSDDAVLAFASSDNRIDQSSYTAKTTSGTQRVEVKIRQDGRTKHSLISTSINEKGSSNPRTVASQNLTQNHRAYDTVIAQNPSPVDSHKSELPSPEGYNAQSFHRLLDAPR